MNVITSVRIIGKPDDLREFIYDNIQVDDPTEEHYKLWNCKNYLTERGHFIDNDNESVPFTTAAMLNIYNRNEESINQLIFQDTTTILASFESSYESMIPALKAMSIYFKNLIIICSKSDEYWDNFYGWYIIAYGNVLLNKDIVFNNLIGCPKDFLEKYPKIIINEITLINKSSIVQIITSLMEDLRNNTFLNVSNLIVKDNKIYFESLDRSVLEWYNSINFPDSVYSSLLYKECRNKYFGYSCKIGNKILASDFLSFKVKKLKFIQNYDTNEDEYIQRVQQLGP